MYKIIDEIFCSTSKIEERWKSRMMKILEKSEIRREKELSDKIRKIVKEELQNHKT